MSALGLPAAAATPFKFLDYYTQKEAHLFAGREQELEEILGGVRRSATFVLFGKSGLGKTSLLLAGLFPALERQPPDGKGAARAWRTVYARILDRPLDDLRAALQEQLRLPGLEGPMSDEELLRTLPAAISQAVQSSPAEPAADAPVAVAARGQTILIVLDQFEELFIRFRQQPEDRVRFARLLAAIAEQSQGGVRLLFSIREDFVAELHELKPFLPQLGDESLRLLPLTAYGARQAITRPLAAADYEDRFVNRLIDDLGKFNFEPAMLQITCTEVYQYAQRERPNEPVQLRASDLKAVGDVDGIFRRYVNNLSGAIPADRQLLLRVMLSELISAEKTRWAIRISDLLKGDFQATETEIREVFEQLTAQRIVRRETRKKTEVWFELLHEKLVANLKEWLDQDETWDRFSRARSNLTNSVRDLEWETGGDLMSGDQMLKVDQHRKHLKLGPRPLELGFRSAAGAGLASAADWATLLEAEAPERAEPILIEMLGHRVLAARIGAARTCDRLARPALVIACAKSALEDSDASVRRACGPVFARHATEDQLGLLRRALADERSSARAIELLSDLVDIGRSIEKFPFRARRKARRQRAARLVDLNAAEVRERESQGGIGGLVGGIGWAAVMGIVGGYAIFSLVLPESATSPEKLVKALATLTGLFGAAGAGLGLLLGWLAARRVARGLLERKEVGWVRLLWSGRGLALTLLAVALVVEIPVLVNLDSLEGLDDLFPDQPWMETVLNVGIFLLIGALAACLTLTTLALFQRVSASSPGAGRYLWLLLAGCIAPLGIGFAAARVLSGALISHGSLSGSRWIGSSAAELICLCAGVCASFATTVIGYSLVYSRSNTLKAGRALPQKLLVGGLAALMGVLYFSTFETNTLPVFARRELIGPQDTESEGPGERYPFYYRFQLGSASAGGARLVEVTNDHTASVYVQGHELENGGLVLAFTEQLMVAAASTDFQLPYRFGKPETGYRFGMREYPIAGNPLGSEPGLVRFGLSLESGDDHEPLPVWKWRAVVPPGLSGCIGFRPLAFELRDVAGTSTTGVTVEGQEDGQHRPHPGIQNNPSGIGGLRGLVGDRASPVHGSHTYLVSPSSKAFQLWVTAPFASSRAVVGEGAVYGLAHALPCDTGGFACRNDYLEAAQSLIVGFRRGGSTDLARLRLECAVRCESGENCEGLAKEQLGKAGPLTTERRDEIRTATLRKLEELSNEHLDDAEFFVAYGNVAYALDSPKTAERAWKVAARGRPSLDEDQLFRSRQAKVELRGNPDDSEFLEKPVP